MRRNFAQVLKEGKIDIKNEYSKLYNIFYGKDGRDDRSIADIVSNNFLYYHFRGTCLTLKEFNEIYGFSFVKEPQDFSEDYLINFMEYIFNMIYFLDSRLLFHDIGKHFYLNHIRCVVELIGYVSTSEGDFTIFVPKDSNAITVANSCNIRHNNKDESSKQYKKYIAEMSDAELEHTYDEIYQMCLLAFMQLENAERKEWLANIKSSIVNVK